MTNVIKMRATMARTGQTLRAALQHMGEDADRRHPGHLHVLKFQFRGLKNHTIELLTDAGYEYPEQLLFVDRAVLKQKALAEIDRYRARFLPEA